MKACWGSGGIAPHFLDLTTRCRQVASFTSWALNPQGKSPWYPLDSKSGFKINIYLSDNYSDLNLTILIIHSLKCNTTLPLERTIYIQYICNSTRHTSCKIAACQTQNHSTTTSHVFTTMVTHTLSKQFINLTEHTFQTLAIIT